MFVHFYAELSNYRYVLSLDRWASYVNNTGILLTYFLKTSDHGVSNLLVPSKKTNNNITIAKFFHFEFDRKVETRQCCPNWILDLS